MDSCGMSGIQRTSNVSSSGRDRCYGNRYCSYEIITQIKRWKDSLYLASTNGLFVLKDNYLTRYDFEPNLEGGTAIVPFKRHALNSP